MFVMGMPQISAKPELCEWLSGTSRIASGCTEPTVSMYHAESWAHMFADDL